MAVASEQTNKSMKRSFDQTSMNMRRVGTGAQAMGRAMVAASVPLIGLGYFAAKAAISFQQNMEMIKTQAGATQAEVDKMSQSVLNLAQSGRVAQGPTQPSQGLFHLESLGLRGAAAFKALQAASQGAAVGNTDLESTASALGAAMVTTHTGAAGAWQMMGLLNATVGAGNMRMADLVQALQMGVIPAFQQAGLKAHDAMAAIATLTDAGYRASSASSQLSTALHFLFEPTVKATKALAGIGMSTTTMAADMHQPNGLLVALRDLKKHLDVLPGGSSGIAAEQVLGAILPGGRGRIMLTMIQNLDRYQNKLAQIQKNTNSFSEQVAATHKTAAFKLKAAWSEIQATLVKLGATLLPIIANILPKFLAIIKSIINFFTGLPPGIKKLLVDMAIFMPLAGGILLILGKFLTTFSKIRDMWIILKALAPIAKFLELAGAAKKAMLAFLGLNTALTVTKAAEAGAAAENLVLAGSEAAVAAGAGTEAAAAGGAAFSRLAASSASSATGALGATAATAGESAAAIEGAGGGALGLGTAAAGEGAGALGAGSLLGPAAWITGGALLLAQLFPGSAKAAVFGSAHFLRQTAAQRARKNQFFNPISGKYSSGSSSGVNAVFPGQDVMSRAAAQNTGGGATVLDQATGQTVHINPSPANFYVDGRLLARSMVQYTLRSAARGPHSQVGGSLATTAASL